MDQPSFSPDLFNASSGLQDHLFSADPQRDSLYIVIPVTIIYISIFVTGTIGNISTCIVIARNKSMHTATNYYLFSLAISDLLLLVSGLPAEIYMVWYKYPYIFGEGFCILRGLAAETSANASVLTITAFTVERYVAICHPFLSQTMSKLTRAVKLILIVWLVGLSFALPQALQFGVVQLPTHPNMMMCTVTKVLLRHSFELSTLLFFVMPMSVITVLYVLIGLKLRKSSMMKRGSGRDQRGSCRHHPGRSSRRVLKMLVAVVIAFFICWAPFHVQRLIAIYGTNTEDHLTSNSKWIEFIYLLMTYISGILYYISTTINPILYNIMSNKFRVAFMETLSRSWRIPGLVIRNEQRSYSSLSRSQQRAIGCSRTAGTMGTRIAPESTDYSGNSVREDSPKQVTSLEQRCMDGDELEEMNTTRNTLHNGNTENHERKNGGNDNGCLKNSSRPTKYATAKTSNVDSDSRKKWWRLLKWFPGLKSLKLAGRSTYAAPGNRTAKKPEVRKEEISMTMWNENSEQWPV
ncbi:pyrokinin-1 receptor-like [Ceratina calcarata]|uniref:Pyrokinin-1 receptor-like n=1 Tax=Ceratina calcarata TaxID=156304 RepID=A0AAJ7RWH2_9HYME|nr:pyrokinin-1 receptor-like [Ceratina calcarata]XP_026666578.1 pyrokinin-1 receptor-like [Ceratina calcarata]